MNDNKSVEKLKNELNKMASKFSIKFIKNLNNLLNKGCKETTNYLYLIIYIFFDLNKELNSYLKLNHNSKIKIISKYILTESLLKNKINDASIKINKFKFNKIFDAYKFYKIEKINLVKNKNDSLKIIYKYLTAFFDYYNSINNNKLINNADINEVNNLNSIKYEVKELTVNNTKDYNSSNKNNKGIVLDNLKNNKGNKSKKLNISNKKKGNNINKYNNKGNNFDKSNKLDVPKNVLNVSNNKKSNNLNKTTSKLNNKSNKLDISRNKDNNFNKSNNISINNSNKPDIPNNKGNKLNISNSKKENNLNKSNSKLNNKGHNLDKSNNISINKSNKNLKIQSKIKKTQKKLNTTKNNSLSKSKISNNISKIEKSIIYKNDSIINEEIQLPIKNNSIIKEEKNNTNDYNKSLKKQVKNLDLARLQKKYDYGRTHRIYKNLKNINPINTINYSMSTNELKKYDNLKSEVKNKYSKMKFQSKKKPTSKKIIMDKKFYSTSIKKDEIFNLKKELISIKTKNNKLKFKIDKEQKIKINKIEQEKVKLEADFQRYQENNNHLFFNENSEINEKNTKILKNQIMHKIKKFKILESYSNINKITKNDLININKKILEDKMIKANELIFNKKNNLKNLKKSINSEKNLNKKQEKKFVEIDKKNLYNFNKQKVIDEINCLTKESNLLENLIDN